MSYTEERKQVNMEAKKLIEASPDMMKAFGNLHQTYKNESAISLKEKEMVSIGISITVKCVPCLLAHVKTFKEVGGTREELVDVINAAILMNGGPGTAYGAKALEIFDEL